MWTRARGTSLLETDATWDIVYTTNKAVLADDVGRRLENFFWRIWSNGQISSNIRGSQVALLFMSISEGGEIRTTPTQSPRSQRNYLEEHRHIRRSPPPVSNALTPSPTSPAASDVEGSQRSAGFATEENTPSKVPRKLSSSQERRRDTRRPPPILKKPKAGSLNYLPKTARILSPTTRGEGQFDDEEESTLSTVHSTDSPSSLGTARNALSPGRSNASPVSKNEHFEVEGQHPLAKGSLTIPRLVEREPQYDVSQRQGRKKTAFAANTAATKRRPAAVRRKSSQPSSGNASKAPSPHFAAQSKVNLESPPPLPSLGTPLDDVDSGAMSPNRTGDSSTVNARTIVPALSFDTKSTKVSRSASPHQSGHSREQSRDPLAMGINPSDTRYHEERAHQDWLVDRDFRSKFVERIRPSENHGLASLRSHRTRSSAALVAPASYQAHATMGFGEQTPGRPPGKERAKLTFTDKMVPLKAPAPSSEAIIDDDEDEDDAPQALPRTTSQLTLLLQRDRRMNDEQEKRKKTQQGRKASS